MRMQMERLLIQVPKPFKAKLDSLRTQGYTASGYIRALLERELNGKEEPPQGMFTLGERMSSKI